MAVQRIGVVGLGIMGAGIAEVWARSGYPVVAVAESAEAVEMGRAKFVASVQRSVAKGRIDQSAADDINAAVTWSQDFADLHDCDLVIEAAPEFMALKHQIFTELDRQVKPSGILATNTSSLSVTDIATATNRRDRVVGMHFFNPAPVQKFVEVISTADSNPGVVAEVAQLAESVGKYVARLTDAPGFIVNHLLLAYINHAVTLLDEGIATREEIDTAMRTRASYPMGPLELADLIGLDTCVEILKTIHASMGSARFAPAAGMVELLAQGHKGRKSAQGFYDYAGKHVPVESTNPDVEARIYEELESAYLADARAMRDSGYASELDIDNGMKLGCGLPEGPFEVMASRGTS